MTSRRFCPVCESEFKGQDLIPRAVVAVALIVGLFGVGTYMRSGPASPAPVAFRQPAKPGLAPQVIQPPAVPQNGSNSASQPVPKPQETSRPMQPASVPRYEAADDTYICGAETKKGTPCSRRVKGNVRCYQHKGMPAMLSPDKLKVG